MHANGLLTIFKGCLHMYYSWKIVKKTICMHGYSLIHVDRSLRVSNLGGNSVPLFKEEKGPFHIDWRTTMHANGF